MKTKTFILLCAVITLASCQKTANNQNNSSSSSNNIDGTFYANEHTSYNVKLYGASGALVNGGAITANGTSVTYSSGAYTQVNSGISGTTHWVVSGNSSNGVPSINYTSKTIPSVGTVSFDTIRKSVGYTITMGSPIVADTIYYSLHVNSPYLTITKYATGSSSKMIFSPSDVSAFNISTNSNGITCYVGISAINNSSSVFGGKNYRFVSRGGAGNSGVYIKN